MHFIVASIFLYTAIRFAAGEDFVSVKCKDENVGLFGQRTILECNLVLLDNVPDVNIQVLDWKRKQERSPVVLYVHGKKTQTPGYDFAKTSWNGKSLDVSLLIKNTTVEDGGEYNYVVSTDRGNSKGKTNLKVKAQYSSPTLRSIPEKSNRDEGGKLICESGGGYPQGELRWLDQDGKECTAGAKTEVTQSANGLFQLSSEFHPLRESIYTCVVFTASGIKESEVSYMPPPSRSTGENNIGAKIAAPAIVIGSLVVGLLLLLVLRRKRRAQYDHHEIPRGEFNVEEGHQKTMDS